VLVNDTKDNDYTVLKVSGSQIQKKDSLAILGNHLFFRKTEFIGDKQKNMLGKMNLTDGTQQLYEISCLLESPTMFFERNIYSSCSGFVSEHGRHIQSPLGCWKLYPGYETTGCVIDWSKEKMYGEVFNQGGSNTISNLMPCPTFGLARRSMNQFDLTMTRKDDLGGNLAGTVTAVFWPEDKEMPPFVKLDTSVITFENIKPDEIFVINIDKNKISTVLGDKTTNMALIFDTNGLLDTLNSDSSVVGDNPIPLFDGAPLSIKTSRALSIAVYKRLVTNY
jgi:hypothetical protein